jgi:hypothetical protein
MLVNKKNIFWSKIIPIFTIFIIDFLFQNFNIITFKFSTCSFYTFNPDCVEFNPFALSKLFRLALNLLSVNLIIKLYKINIANKLIYVSIALFIYIIDMVMCYSKHPLLLNWHKVLNPFLFSPLIGVALLAWLITTKKTSFND